MNKSSTNTSKLPLADYFVESEARDVHHYASTFVKTLHKSIRGNLEDLLNTNRPSFSLPTDLAELRKSIVNYGVDSINCLDLGSERERDELCSQLKEAIEIYEPRLKYVNVSLEKAFDTTERIIKLRIEALLLVNSINEPVVFTSGLDKENGKFTVSNEIY